MRVIKLGGSLLAVADVADRFRTWLAGQEESGSRPTNLVLAGGGRFADAVREADRLHKLAPAAAHWLAIRALGVTARLLAELLPEASLCEELPAASPSPGRAAIAILDPWQFLRSKEPGLPGRCLPPGWHVTSDSIAARVAEVLHADELVLLKSCLPPPDATLAESARQGLVDEYFPAAAASLARVRWVNLRDAGFPEAIYQR